MVARFASSGASPIWLASVVSTMCELSGDQPVLTATSSDGGSRSRGSVPSILLTVSACWVSTRFSTRT
jgi:hypothetical protein